MVTDLLRRELLNIKGSTYTINIYETNENSQIHSGMKEWGGDNVGKSQYNSTCL